MAGYPPFYVDPDDTIEDSDADPDAVVLKKILNCDYNFLGKTHALKKYDQSALNTSCFWGKYQIKYYPSCAISRNLCYKNNEYLD